MLKEENELRDTYRSFVPNFQRAALANKITALIRAVREDAVQVSKEYLHEAYHRRITEEELLDGIAAIIREGK